jgi:hypothetical protein
MTPTIFYWIDAILGTVIKGGQFFYGGTYNYADGVIPAVYDSSDTIYHTVMLQDSAGWFFNIVKIPFDFSVKATMFSNSNVVG